jgi:hypothetical protein
LNFSSDLESSTQVCDLYQTLFSGVEVRWSGGVNLPMVLRSSSRMTWIFC